MMSHAYRAGHILWILMLATGCAGEVYAQCASAGGLSAPTRDVTVVAGGKVYRNSANKPYPAGTRVRWSVPSNGFANFNANMGGYHPGEDWNLEGAYNNDLGEPIYAIGNGVVEKVSPLGSLGWLVAVRHDAPSGSSLVIPADRGTNYSYGATRVTSLFSVYVHISGNRAPPAGVVTTHTAPPVAVGQCVSANTVVGYVLNPGYGPHLHFEVRRDPGPKSLPRQLGVVRDDWFGNNWSMVKPSVNWVAGPNGYYKQAQRMVDSGFWRSQSVQGANVKALLATPAPGSTLSASGTVFTWSAGSSASGYWIYIGSGPGSNDLYSASQGLNRSIGPLSRWPADGRPVYVTLWSLIGSSWLSDMQKYYAPGRPAAPSLRVNGAKSASGSAGQQLVFDGWGFSSLGTVSRWICGPLSCTQIPSLRADAAGRFTWTYVAPCSTGTFTDAVWVINDNTNQGASVNETIVASSCM